jgi:glycine/D-amino acid oxidase-like deaminating enzyme
VLEQHRVGWGASGRNGGFVLPGFKPDPDELIARFGIDRARQLFRTSLEAIGFLERVLADEAIECEYGRRGSVTLASRPSHLKALEQTRRTLRARFGHDTVLLSATEVRGELDSSHYHGGLLEPAAGCLHPIRYCAGLAAAAARAGAVIVEGVEVLGVQHEAGGFQLQTSAGPLIAGEVLVATNGYTGAAFPDLRRRVVPVGSYVIATAPLTPAEARRLIPNGRVLSDTWNLLHYFRRSDDHRIVFGGRASFSPTSIERSTRILVRAMRAVFRSLANVPVEFAWSGQICVARDRMPHAGKLAGAHYALGYAGHGVALSTWLGARMGDALAGREPMPELTGNPSAIPFYRGRPWFLPAVGAYYRLKDRLS